MDSKARLLGPWMTTALVIGNIIGAGIFLLPATLAPLGQNAIYGWLLTIAGALCLAWVFAQLAAKLGGGPYAYVHEAAGELPAFMVMWSYWISIWAGLPVLAIAAVSYASSIFPAIGGSAAPFAAIAAVWLLALVNMRGARAAGAVQLVTTLLKLLPLIAVVLVATFLFERGDDAAALAPTPVSAGAIATAGTLALFSMLGVESASVAAAKVANPARVIPRATMAGTALVGIVYLAACTAVLFLLPGATAAASPAPFADAIAPALGAAAGTLIAAFAVISALGCLNGWILCSGEVPLALARDGVFPRWLAATTAIGTPVRAQFVSCVLATLLIASNYSRSMADLFAFMLLVTTTVTLVLYFACAASALVLMARRRVRAPLLGAAAVLSLAFAIWAVWGAGAEAASWGLALLATGVPVYYLMRWKGSSTPAAEAS
ncbi:MAG TPA: amino acid permease [Sphingomicrobium sp.]|nr:amino acid permease [Sphingomicrobium sp.]